MGNNSLQIKMEDWLPKYQNTRRAPITDGFPALCFYFRRRDTKVKRDKSRKSVCVRRLTHLWPNLVLRVLWLFGQRMGASRDSGIMAGLEFLHSRPQSRVPFGQRHGTKALAMSNEIPVLIGWCKNKRIETGREIFKKI